MSTLYDHYEIVWDGIRIAVDYAPKWSSSEYVKTAHLTLETIAPARAPLPVTKTGYTSHFCSDDLVMEYGGPVAYALAWLNTEAKSSAWRNTKAQRQQLSLF